MRGFRMPAEWEAHGATWIAWPHNRSDWPGKFASVPWVYGEIVRRLARSERVRILVADRAHEAKSRHVLSRVGADLTQVDYVLQATDRSWTRDTAPLFVRDKAQERVAMVFRFNAWAKYADWKRDVRVARAVARAAGVPARDVKVRGKPVVLEGGAVDADGAGTLLATEECLLSPVQARNPALTRKDMEQVFADTLGIDKVIWLARGIVGDDTHGHIDDVCRFVAPGLVVLPVEPDARDPNHAILAENRERLKSARDAAGRQLDVVALPMPQPLWFRGQRLPASYANFYIANGLVLVPTFNDPNDRVALGVLAELFPDRDVVGIHAVDLVLGLGALHCMTREEPA
jgi:agmatine deiminase